MPSSAIASPVARGKTYWLPEDYPEWRIVDRKRQLERRDAGMQGMQVQSFILLERMHSYINDARREVETQIGTALCREHCCCSRSTPFVTRLEAEYIISRSGYYSALVGVAEEWLVTPHVVAPTFPAELPGVIGGKLKAVPQVAREMRALASLRSPFLLAQESTHLERLTVGAYFRNSYVDGAAVQDEAWDLLEDTQPLVCAVSGVFTLPPEWCRRRTGLGENEHSRAIADPATLKRYWSRLTGIYQKMPDKAQYGFLPTMIMMVGNPFRFAKLAGEGKIALAKLGVGSGVCPGRLWEGQVYGESERKITISAAGASGGSRGLLPGLFGGRR